MAEHPTTGRTRKLTETRRLDSADRQRDQELAATCQINRELIDRLNRERTQPRPRT